MKLCLIKINAMKILNKSILLLLFLIPCVLISQEDLVDKIKGSWKLYEIHYEYKDTTYIMKEEDHGRFIFTDENYALMYNPRMQQRKPFKDLSKPENEEIINAFKSIVFNTGSYTIEDNIISATADIAKVPGFEGGQQYYRMKLVDDTLELVMYDETYPNGKKPEWYKELKIKFRLKRE